MTGELVKGNGGLARRLGVHVNTVFKWRKLGVLRDATVVDYGKTIVYDLEAVFCCLHHNPRKPGRPRGR